MATPDILHVTRLLRPLSSPESDPLRRLNEWVIEEYVDTRQYLPCPLCLGNDRRYMAVIRNRVTGRTLLVGNRCADLFSASNFHHRRRMLGDPDPRADVAPPHEPILDDPAGGRGLPKCNRDRGPRYRLA